MITVNSSQRLGRYSPKLKFPSEFLVKLPNWLTKSKILEIHCHQPHLVLDGSEISTV